METNMQVAVSVESLTKSFGKHEAVKGISFDVASGSIFGFLGPNGAGKTTTMRMITGMLAPTSGRITVAGLDMPSHRDQIKTLMGVVPDHQNLYDRLTARRQLRLFADLTGVAPARVDEVVSLVGLDEYADIPTIRLSRGWRQRVLIARGLLHRPKVFFLDEPTSALDPQSALSIRRVVRSLRDEGTTVFLTTHYMEEASDLCDQIAILHDGRIVASDTPDNIRMQFGRPLIDVTLHNRETGADRTVSLPIADPETPARISGWLSEGSVVRIHTQEATLEEAFLRLTGSSWQPQPETCNELPKSSQTESA
ncbi:ABC transporter ATP-binding protein [Candidatus Ozemobacteraceae bacterium]|nr:ABC transporter ATP-binding protein [Candidatus Ozemobacteraceae bacterium]